MPTLPIVLTSYGENRQDVAEVCSDILGWDFKVIESVLLNSLVVKSPELDFVTVGGIFLDMGESLPPSNFWWYVRRTGSFVTATYCFSGLVEQYFSNSIREGENVQDIINFKLVPKFLQYIKDKDLFTDF